MSHIAGRGSRWPTPILIAATMSLVAGCASHPKPPPPAPTSAPPAPPPAAAPSYVPTPPPAAVESKILPGSEQDFVVNVGDRVYFDFNAYLIRPDGAQVLERQASWLVRYPQVRVRIEGNCDERGTEEYNFALGARRAGQVKSFLTAHGVDIGRISTVSYGKSRPIDTGPGEEARAHNRNAHTAIVGGTP